MSAREVCSTKINLLLFNNTTNIIRSRIAHKLLENVFVSTDPDIKINSFWYNLKLYSNSNLFSRISRSDLKNYILKDSIFLYAMLTKSVYSEFLYIEITYVMHDISYILLIYVVISILYLLHIDIFAYIATA